MGCPAISFGWGRGHIRMNNAAFRRHGLAEVAVGPAELRAALDRALAKEKAEDMSFAALPSAASVVLTPNTAKPPPKKPAPRISTREPIVAKPFSKFTVTVEYIELVPPPAPGT